MNNINNIVSIINEHGGAASLEDILSAYVKQWHILPVAENKQKIKSTLISYNGILQKTTAISLLKAKLFWTD